MRRLRVVAHVHSDWSDDASWSLSDISRAFARMQIDAVLMSEHDRTFTDARWAEYQDACAEASNSRILLVPGIEYQDRDNVVHTPVWGPDVPFLGRSRPTLDLLRDANAAGAVALFAHPWRHDAYTRYEEAWAPLLTGIEVWNRKYDGLAPNSLSAVMAERESLAPFVSLDFHTWRQMFPLFTMIEVGESISEGAIVEAMHKARIEATLLGMDISRFVDGPLGVAAQMVERIRRRAAPALRHILP